MGAVKERAPQGAEPQLGTFVDGRYRVEAALGEGAMGAVFRVRDGDDGEPLALKRLRVDWSDPRRAGHALLRFRREFHTMAQFRHPRIVRVHDFGQDADGAYYTMELLEGEEVGDLAPVSPDQTCAILRDVASALAFLHARRLLHRDVAPRNVRLGTDGRAKLMDFGILATIGVAGEVAGTPTCVPPEALRGLPLDHRADLYGLGALGYYLLTGGHAHPAHSVFELEALWAKRPPPPSAYRSDVPVELDELIMAMLSQDPLGRPSSAAEVIDRLSAIAALEADPETEAARGWLQSAVLVGRQREMGVVRQLVRASVGGEGGALVFEAPSGMGKSRLLREAGLEGQLAGATVLRANAEGEGQGPYAILRELTSQALRSCPEDALEAAADHAAVIGRVLPELLERSEGVAPAEPHGDPAQERVEQQRHIVEWLSALSERRALVLLVDDIQRCDEASGAALAALAHAAPATRIALMVGLRTDEEVNAPGAVAAVRDGATRRRVRGLSREEVGELVHALFGDARHAGVLAETIHRLGGGGPLHCTELARHFVDEGSIRYDGGAWILPPRIDERAVPRGLAEAMDARVAGLDAPTEALGQALAVQGGDIPLSLCMNLADEDDPERVFAALDALVFDEILVGAEGTYRFRHDGLREALLRRMSHERRRQLHLRAGEALASAQDDSAEQQARIGLHFERGGDDQRAADYLERAGRELYAAHSFSDSIAPLEAALRIREAAGQDPVRCIEIRQMLMRGGVLCDREVILRYADETIDALRHSSGMHHASRWARRIGRLPALALGLAWAWLRWLARRPSRRGPNPVESLTTLITLVNYTASAHSLSFDLARLRPLVQMLEPLAVLRGRVPRGAFLMTENFHSMALGRYARVSRNIDEMLHIVERDRLTPLSEIDRRMALGGAYYMRASAKATAQDPAYEEDLSHLEGLDLRFFEAAAQMDRLFFHRLRGEEEAAGDLRDATEVMFVQLGNVWVFESQLQWISALAYGFTRDVLGLKRCVEGLDRLVREGYALEPFAALTRGEYLRERGDLAASRQTLQALLDGLPGEQDYVRQHALAALAETHLALGATADARNAASRGRELAGDPEVGQYPVRVRCGRALALVEAAEGELAGAARRLEALIDETAALASPCLSGSLHEARARVALQAHDEEGFQAHLAAAERWFRPTRNPALVSRLERLAKSHADRRASGHPPAPMAVEAVTAVDVAHPAARVAKALEGARGPVERAVRSLDVLLDESAAAHGFLFLAREEGLELTAPAGVAAPDGMATELSRMCALAARGTATSAPRTYTSFDGQEEKAWLPVVLLVTGSEPRVVGAAALVGGSLPLRMPAPDVVREVARALGREHQARAAC